MNRLYATALPTVSRELRATYRPFSGTVRFGDDPSDITEIRRLPRKHHQSANLSPRQMDLRQWAMRGTMILLAGFGLLLANAHRNAAQTQTATPTPYVQPAPTTVLPTVAAVSETAGFIPRNPLPAPNIAYDPQSRVLAYTVQPGDGLFAISQNLKALGYFPPETPEQFIIDLFVNNPANGITDEDVIYADRTYLIAVPSEIPQP